MAEQTIAVPAEVTPVDPTGEQNEPACTTFAGGGDVAGGCVIGAGVTGGAVGGDVRGVVGGDVGGDVGRGVTGVVVGGEVTGETIGGATEGACETVVFGATVVVADVVTVVLLDFVPAPAIPAIRSTIATGTAIFAHNGHDRNRPRLDGVVVDEVEATVGMTCVGDSDVTGTG